MTADLAKNTIRPNMRRFRVLSLNDNTALLTALANDLGYENVLEAIRYAQHRCAEAVGILGFQGGAAAELVDRAIVVPSGSPRRRRRRPLDHQPHRRRPLQGATRGGELCVV